MVVVRLLSFAWNSGNRLVLLSSNGVVDPVLILVQSRNFATVYTLGNGADGSWTIRWIFSLILRTRETG
jgi:hypothetical protein